MHPNEWQIIKLQGSHSPVDMWNMLVVNITSEQGIPNYVIDSPDSSWVRLLTYLYGLATGWVMMSDLIRRKSGYNTNPAQGGEHSAGVHFSLFHDVPEHLLVEEGDAGRYEHQHVRIHGWVCYVPLTPSV